MSFGLFRRRLAFSFCRCLSFGLFRRRLAFCLHLSLLFGFYRGLAARFSGGLALGFISGGLSSLTFGLFRRRLAFGFRFSLPFGFCFGLPFRLCRYLPFGFRFTLDFQRRFAFRLFGGFAAYFFLFPLAANFRLTSRLRLPFSPRQFRLPLCFLALAMTFFLGLAFQFCLDRSLIHHFRWNRLNFIRLRTWRTPQIQIQQQKNPEHSM